MNADLRERVVEQLARYEMATLATCGPAGVQVSGVTYRAQGLHVLLQIPSGSDHLFNLEEQPAVALLTPSWRLDGLAAVRASEAAMAQRPGQSEVRVEPARLHLLGEDGRSVVETIDF